MRMGSEFRVTRCWLPSLCCAALLPGRQPGPHKAPTVDGFEARAHDAFIAGELRGGG